LPFERIDRRRDIAGQLDRVQCAANPLAKIRVANRNQPWQYEPAVAIADKRLSQGSDGTIVGKQDAAPRQGQRIAADGGD
jgi:hypothetical protein